MRLLRVFSSGTLNRGIVGGRTIPPGSMQIVGACTPFAMGIAHRLASNGNAEDRELNRRVDVKVLVKKESKRMQFDPH
jgi:hypothetical protein